MNSKFTSAYLFYDVLSGEFTPPCDPDRRNHTLARLSIAAFQKGETKSAPRDTVAYRPSWAAGSLATVEALRSGDLTGLVLTQDIPAGGSNWASFSKFHGHGVRSGAQVRLADSTGIERVEPLRLGAELNDLRDVAADVAQGFYDRLYAAVENQAIISQPVDLSRIFPRSNPES